MCAFDFFEKEYHFMKSARIYCMILTMALCFHPFPRLIDQKWKSRCANLGLFWIQPCAPPPASGFQNQFGLQRNEFPISKKDVNGEAFFNHPKQHTNNRNNTLVTG